LLIALAPNIFFELGLVHSALLMLFAITPGSHPGLFTFDPFRVGCIELQVVAAPGVCAVVGGL